MHIHILGICGTFMGGIARLAVEMGHQVSGSDMNVYPPMSTQLEQLGIDIIEGYDAAQLDSNPDCIVVGNVMTRGHEVIEMLLERKIPIISGPQWIKDNVLKDRWVLAVAGTHGKTTTTSLIASIFQETKLDPTIINGGVINSIKNTAKLGKSDWSILEADESDGSFVHIAPTYSIITNIDREHMDFYKSRMI